MNIEAYCRVLPTKTKQLNSLETQKEFFSEYTKRTGNTLARLYAEEGYSAVKIANILNEKRLMTKRNCKWSQNVICRILTKGEQLQAFFDFLKKEPEDRALALETVTPQRILLSCSGGLKSSCFAYAMKDMFSNQALQIDALPDTEIAAATRNVAPILNTTD